VLVEKSYYSLGNVALNKVEAAKTVIAMRDDVYAIHSPYWPDEVVEWITRTRNCGFPSKSVIKQIVKYGCDFVQASHKLSANIEWRFSFSRAEYFIAKSWTMSQRIVYTTLWVLNKRVASSYLCTYYFKTLMFWACEEKPVQFWNERSFIHSVCELLIVMITWVQSRFCPNYFIPGNNMMDHLIDTDLSYEIDALRRSLQSHQPNIDIRYTCWLNEILSANTVYHITSPAWIKRAFLIYRRVNNDHDNFKDLFGTELTPAFKNALYVELSDIYGGLCFQQKSVSWVNVSDKHIYFLKSEMHLLRAINLCESYERDEMNNCPWRMYYLLVNDFRLYDPDLSTEFDVLCETNETSRIVEVPGDTNDHHSIEINRDNFMPEAGKQNSLYDRNDEPFEEKHKNEKDINLIENSSYEGRSRPICIKVRMITNVNISAFTDTKMDTFTDIKEKVFREWPGFSPTVNISWFIAKAYLANLYYTTQRDVSLTIKTCDDIINVYWQSKMNRRFAEKIFPVVLSTQWTSIYDKEIQELLGFYSLSSYVFDKCSSRSVYLGVCPVQFAHYVKVRSATEHTFSDAILDFDTHIKECVCDKNVNNGTIAVTKASRPPVRWLKYNIVNHEL